MIQSIEGVSIENRYSLTSIVCHELGHALGLGHASRVLADLDADPDRIRDLVIAELPEPRERDSRSPAPDQERE